MALCWTVAALMSLCLVMGASSRDNTGGGGGINANCPFNCSCNDETLTAVCSEVGLNEAPITLNPSIERLILNHNRIKTADVAAFQFYRLLKYLDFSDNQLMKIPANVFELQVNLVELHLNRNKISSVADKTFYGLKSLTVLNLRGNFLEELPDKVFNNLSHLEELDLGQNRLTKIGPSIFEGLPRLRVLHLDDNQLKSVPTQSFKYLGSLAELRIGLNAFDFLPNDCFAGLDHLTLLDVSKAGLIDVNENAFKGLITLRTLILTDNKFNAVPTKQLSKLSRLEDLNIGQNRFDVIGKDAFRGLNNLRKVEISGALQLVAIENEAFASNLNLETLIFTSNRKFNHIDSGALSGLPNLKQLVLRENGFTGFLENLVAWPELVKIDLSDNPVNCQCSLLWLRDLLLQRNHSHVLCDTPYSLKGKSLKSLSDESLGCEIYPSSRQTVIGAICGVALAVVALLLMILCRYRHKICDMFKNYRKKKQSKANGKQSQYQKTFNDEEFIIRTGHHQTLKPIPVTEL